MEGWRSESTCDFGHKPKTKTKTNTDIQPCLVRLPCGHATLYIRLKWSGATVRATIAVDDSSKKVMSQTPGMLFFAHKGFRLDFLQADQCFLAEPRVTLGDSIELFAIVTSSSPFEPEELDFPLKTVD